MPDSVQGKPNMRAVNDDALPPPVNPSVRRVVREGRQRRQHRRHRLGLLRRVWQPDVMFGVTLAFAAVSIAFGLFGRWKHLPVLFYSALFSLVMLAVSERQWFARTSSRRGGGERRDHFTMKQTGVVVVLMVLCGFWYFYERGIKSMNWLITWFG